jgi:hypothetical protein
MKTAIYIEDGVVQLVITPESDFEKNAVNSLVNKPTHTQIFTGSFYDCRGGWTRQSEISEYPLNRNNSENRSIIIRTDDRSRATPGPMQHE